MKAWNRHWQAYAQGGRLISILLKGWTFKVAIFISKIFRIIYLQIFRPCDIPINIRIP